MFLFRITSECPIRVLRRFQLTTICVLAVCAGTGCQSLVENNAVVKNNDLGSIQVVKEWQLRAEEIAGWVRQVGGGDPTTEMEVRKRYGNARVAVASWVAKMNAEIDMATVSRSAQMDLSSSRAEEIRDSVEEFFRYAEQNRMAPQFRNPALVAAVSLVLSRLDQWIKTSSQENRRATAAQLKHALSDLEWKDWDRVVPLSTP